ncbi:hypothetical protein DOE76_17620 [Leifsonia sp. ku-ls]|jgi:hypothetical protein|nr:hypothetical protein DOE76_17620 [Leifsonia sp. ku-ls]
MTSTTSPLLDDDVLPMVELLALCLDGQVYRVGDAFASADTPDGPELRAHAFARTAPAWTVADRGSAAWIHGTRASPPPLPQVCVPPSHRGGGMLARLDTAYRTLAADETVALSGIRVTSPLRTAHDLLCSPGGFSDADALEVRHLLLLAGETPAGVDDRLRAMRRRGRDLARSRLPLVARASLTRHDGVER